MFLGRERGDSIMRFSYRYLYRAMALITAFLTVVGAAVMPAQASERTLTRLAGATRYETMEQVSRVAFSGRSDYVVLASGTNFPDALSASSLAGALQAPVVLTDSKSLSGNARGEILRLSARTVVIVGGLAAVSSTVEQQVGNLVPGGRVVRLSGSTRYETALTIYRKAPSLFGIQWSRNAVVTTGTNFADALSISPYAFATASPIFLSSKDGIGSDSFKVLSKQNFDSAIIVGGAQAVPSGIDRQLQGRGMSVSRLSGATRYETSTGIARFTLRNVNGAPEDVVFATGRNFPDALSGGALAGMRHTVLLLVENESSPTISFAVQRLQNVRNIYVLGGKSAVSVSTVNAISSRYGMGNVETEPSRPATPNKPNGNTSHAKPDEYVSGYVTPGAFCKKSQVGKKGHSKTGKIMVCSYRAGDSAKYPRWRAI